MIRLRWMLPPVAMLALTGSALVACGGDDGGSDNGGSDNVAATATPAAAGGEATTAPEGESVELGATAADFSFTLDKDALSKSSNVIATLTNSGSAPHTLTFYTDKGYTEPLSSADSGQISGGDIGGFSFTTPADGDELYYRCEVHPSQMQGEIGLE